MRAETGEPRRRPLPDGRLVACAHRHDPLAWSGLLEDSPYDDALADLTAGDVVVDVGAHIGLTSLFVAHRAPGARIVAVEPAPLPYDCLADNFRRLLPEATALNVALGAHAGQAELTIRPQHTTMSTLYVDDRDDEANLTAVLDNWQVDPAARDQFWREFRSGVERVTVPVRTLGEVMDEHGLDQVGLLKIDVERAELNVLRGVRDEQWDRVRRVVAEVHDIGDNLAALWALLTQRGFGCRSFQEPPFTGGSLHIVDARRGPRDCGG